ncbi:MAG TPA: winged helix DNA-binding domain-containing protein [Candidatus Dormibacteraeota bacterium]
MTGPDILCRRLHNQRLGRVQFARAEEAVGWLGAVQAQDYSGAKWALAQRTRGATDMQLDRLFAEGVILRTHVMRPTWHFVLPHDIRWLLQLTAPRVNAASAYYYRKVGLDEALFRHSNRALAGALEGGQQLTRTELARVLERAGIPASGIRLAYLMMRAELDAVVCSGARRGKQFTYALLDERAPVAAVLDHDEALAELARRYFTSHGPALLQDYVWWSGLTVADARAGVEMAASHLAADAIDGRTYWSARVATGAEDRSPVVHLLPNYDEYLIAYRDHTPAFDPSLFTDASAVDRVLARHILVIDGRVMGGWRRLIEKDRVTVEVEPLAPLGAAQEEALQAEVERYEGFIGMPASLVFRQPSA